VVELNKANNLDGVVIDFLAGKDPVTCVNARMKIALDEMMRAAPRRVFPGAASGRASRQSDDDDPDAAGALSDRMNSTGLSALQIARAREQATQAAWSDVRLRAYFEFKQGDRHGKAATWDADGQRIFWGNYHRGNRDAFCCLFQNNRPRIVVAFNQGNKGPVYLIANNRVEKSFANEEEAQLDPAATLLLNRLDEVESLFKQGERLLESRVKKSVQAKLGNLNQYKRALEQMRRSARDARQKQGFQDLQKAASFK
jgi:hypothetical protein